jgi:hypothetical protein
MDVLSRGLKLIQYSGQVIILQFKAGRMSLENNNVIHYTHINTQLLVPYDRI